MRGTQRIFMKNDRSVQSKLTLCSSQDINPYIYRYIYNIYICMPRYFANTKHPEAKSLPVLAKNNRGNAQPPLLWIKEVPLQRTMSGGCPNDTQLRPGNKTSDVSWIWDDGYKWVNPDYSFNECGILLVQTLQLCFLYTKSNLNISYTIMHR